MTTPTPGQPLSEADVLPCTDCDGTGITTQTERACSCAAGDAYRPHAPVSRPGDGVEWPAVTNVWAETYCELTGKNPDGQQVTFVDGATVTTFRDMAKREIEAMLCAAPKAAVRAIAALTPPAEPVSRPAGEGEVEEALSCLADYDHTGRLEKAVRSAIRPQPSQQADAGREAIRKVIHELWQLLDDGQTGADGIVTIDQARYQEVSKAMDDLEALVPDSAGPFWGGFPVNYFWSLK